MANEGSLCQTCQNAADVFGDHQVCCGGNGDWIYHHDAIRDAVFSVTQAAATEEKAPSWRAAGQLMSTFLIGRGACQLP